MIALIRWRYLQVSTSKQPADGLWSEVWFECQQLEYQRCKGIKTISRNMEHEILQFISRYDERHCEVTDTLGLGGTVWVREFSTLKHIR